MGVLGARKARPVADNLLDLLRDGAWVSRSRLLEATRMGTVGSLASAINRLRTYGFAVESDVMYRLEAPAIPRAHSAYASRDNVLHIGHEYWEAIGRPKRAAFKYDCTQGVLGISAGDASGIWAYIGERHAEIAIPGLFEMFNVPSDVSELMFECRIRRWYILLRPVEMPRQCPTCNGKGVIR